jgi:hypothetical protein
MGGRERSVDEAFLDRADGVLVVVPGPVVTGSGLDQVVDDVVEGVEHVVARSAVEPRGITAPPAEHVGAATAPGPRDERPRVLAERARGLGAAIMRVAAQRSSGSGAARG